MALLAERHHIKCMFGRIAEVVMVLLGYPAACGTRESISPRKSSGLNREDYFLPSAEPFRVPPVVCGIEGLGFVRLAIATHRLTSFLRLLVLGLRQRISLRVALTVATVYLPSLRCGNGFLCVMLAACFAMWVITIAAVPQSSVELVKRLCFSTSGALLHTPFYQLSDDDDAIRQGTQP